MFKRVLEYLWYSIAVNMLLGVVYGFSLSAIIIGIPLFTVGIYTSSVFFRRGVKDLKEAAELFRKH